MHAYMHVCVRSHFSQHLQFIGDLGWSNSISESNCHSERTGQEGEEAIDMEEPDNESVDEDIAGEQEEEVIAFPRPDNEQKLLWDTYKVTIGFDGSLVHNGDYVYVLPLGEVMQIDYFHGCNCNGSPVCQMMDEDESDFVASELIALQRGFVANRIINVQRRWRHWHVLASLAVH